MKNVRSALAGASLSLLVCGCGGPAPAPTTAEPAAVASAPAQPSQSKPAVPPVTVPTVPAKPVPIAEPLEKIEPVVPEYDLTSGRRFIHFGDKQQRIMVTDFDRSKFENVSTQVIDRSTGKTVGKVIPKAKNHGFSRDGKWFATSEGKTARVWEVETGEPISPPLTVPTEILQVALSPDGKRIAIGCRVAAVYLFAVETGKALPSPKATGSVSPIRTLGFSPDGTMLAYSYWHNAFVWNLATATLSPQLVHKQDVTTVQFSLDGKKLVTGSGDKTARLWETSGGKSIGSPMVHPDGVNSAVFSHDGKSVATVCFDNIVRIWNSTTGEPIGKPIDFGARPVSIGFDPKGERIAASLWGGGGAVFSVATSKRICGLKFLAFGGVASFSPDGTSVVIFDDDKTKIFNAETGEEIP